MVGVVLAAVVSLGGLAFDMTSVLALMYPGRERVEIVGSDGATYVYACKPGPEGETPRAQAEKAMAAFEVNAGKFAEVFVGKVLQDSSDGASTLGTALTLNRDATSWSAAILTHLEKTYGCVLLG